MEDEILQKKKEKSDIYSYGCEASNLIKNIIIIQHSIDFYLNEIKLSKSNFENYLQISDKKLLKDLIIKDIKNKNFDITKFNNIYKIDIQNNEIKNEKLKSQLLENTISLIEEKDKKKEDNFILFNEILCKDEILKILKNEKNNLSNKELFREEYRTIFDGKNDLVTCLLEKELKLISDKFIVYSKYHNSYSNKNLFLDKIKNNLINTINDYSSIHTAPNIKYNKGDLLNNYYLIIRKEYYKKKNWLDDIFFEEFEDFDDDENDLINLNTENIQNKFEGQNKIEHKYSITTLQNRKVGKSMNFIPKLNLKQIEYNKIKICIMHNKTQNYQENKKGFQKQNSIQDKIEQMKIKIIEIIEKNKQLKKLIKKFEKFYHKINKKISKMEEQIIYDDNPNEQLNSIDLMAEN
jgi:hypothetical protein